MLPKGNIIEYKRIDKLGESPLLSLQLAINRIRRVEEDETRRQVTHLVMLARGLLPTENDPPELSPRVKALLSSNDDDQVDASSGGPKLTLRTVRLSNIDAKRHDHAWNENSRVQAYKFSVGDFGYIPEGKDFNDFVSFGNVFKDELAEFPVESQGSGQQWCWKDLPIQRANITPYSLPGDVKW